MSDRTAAFEDYMERAYGRAWDHYLPNESIQFAQAAFYAGYDASVIRSVGTR